MHYVYTLSFNNTVFYVGCTKNAMARYLGHLQCDTEQTKYFIHKMLLKHKKPPVLKIVFHSKKREKALNYEKTLIKYYAGISHKLANIHGNNKSNIIPFEKIDNFKKEFYFEFRYDHKTSKNITSYINKHVYKIPPGCRVGYNQRIVKGN